MNLYSPFMQKLSFYRLKGRLLPSGRCPFTTQKDTFRKTRHNTLAHNMLPLPEITCADSRAHGAE